MSRTAIRVGVNPAEFLAWERLESSKHEYYRGEIFDMSGGSPRHAALAGRVIRRLGAKLDGRCEIFSSDLQIALPDGDHYVYGDATIVCGGVHIKEGTKDVVDNPAVVVEVLSRSTEQYDRGLKWEGYQRIPSLTDYVLVSQGAPRIEHFRRERDETWRYLSVGSGESVELSNGVTLVVDEIFLGAFEIVGD